jgi:hypothetical protein
MTFAELAPEALIGAPRRGATPTQRQIHLRRARYFSRQPATRSANAR